MGNQWLQRYLNLTEGGDIAMENLRIQACVMRLRDWTGNGGKRYYELTLLDVESGTLRIYNVPEDVWVEKKYPEILNENGNLAEGLAVYSFAKTENFNRISLGNWESTGQKAKITVE